MLMPSIFGEDLFDDFFGDFPFYYDDRAMKDTEKKLVWHDIAKQYNENRYQGNWTTAMSWS